MQPSAIPLGLYVHFPWCVRKCPYCDFNSHSLRGDTDEIGYVDALLRDLDWELDRQPESRQISSAFFGGGTPSLFSGAAMQRLMDGLRSRLGFVADAEITLEANPGTVDEAHFAAYRAAGINRLSIGIQSLDAAKLKALGRIHDPDQARRAVQVARSAGFDNLNLDLMFALPQQTLAEAAADLDGVLALAPEHVSYYHLTIEPNTAFAHQPPSVPDEDLAADMLDQALAQLALAGFARYEVSAYAREGRRSRHNLNYWTFGDYLGLGAGAHAKRSGLDGIRRAAREKHPQRYLAQIGRPDVEQDVLMIEAAQRPFEYLMNALRLDEPRPWQEFVERTGLDQAALQTHIAPLVARGLMRSDARCFGTTETGYAHLNSVLQHLL